MQKRFTIWHAVGISASVITLAVFLITANFDHRDNADKEVDPGEQAGLPVDEKPLSKRDAKTFKDMMASCEAINKQCPMPFGDGTTMTAIKAIPPRTIRYEVSGEDYDYPDADSATLESMKTAMFSAMLESLKANSATKDYRDMGIVFVYSCSGTDGKLFHEFKFRPEDYNK